MRKWRKLYIEIYHENIWFVKCDVATYRRLVRQDFQQEPAKIEPFTYGRHVYLTGDDGISTYTIWVTKWEALTHEIFHCVHKMLDSKGLWLENCSEEAYAYLIEYLDNQFRSVK